MLNDDTLLLNRQIVLLFKLKFNQTLGATMNKKLIIGLGLSLASLNLMSAVQRVVPRVALSAGG